MSEITLTTNRHKIKERKWFGLGRPIQGQTVPEIIREAGMDWTVSKRPVVTTAYIPPETQREKEDQRNPNPLSPNGTPRVENLRYHLGRLLDHLDDKNIIDEVRHIMDETEGTYLPHRNEFSIVRNDTNHPFGVMGLIYECLDNEDCLDMISPLLDSGKIVAERAGEFNDGANCWVLVKFPNSIVVGTDELDQYMKVSWSHDGTEKLSATFIAIMKRTNTQINPKIPGADVSIEIRHTTNAPERIKLAKKLLSKGETYFQKLEEVLSELINMPMTNDEMEEYLKTLIPDSKKARPDEKTGKVKPTRASGRRTEILEIFNNSDSNVAHTKYAAFGSVAEWCDHKKGVRVTGQDKAEGDEEKLEQMSTETRMKGIWFKSGSARQLKDKAFSLIVK